MSNLRPAADVSDYVQQLLRLLDMSAAEHVGVLYPQVVQPVNIERLQLPVQFLHLLLADESGQLLPPQQVGVEEGADL